MRKHYPQSTEEFTDNWKSWNPSIKNASTYNRESNIRFGLWTGMWDGWLKLLDYVLTSYQGFCEVPTSKKKKYIN